MQVAQNMLVADPIVLPGRFRRRTSSRLKGLSSFTRKLLIESVATAKISLFRRRLRVSRRVVCGEPGASPAAASSSVRKFVRTES